MTDATQRRSGAAVSIELRHLRSFVAVVDHGTFSAAAAALHIGQPALSRTIAQSERLLGVALFDRSTHHCAPTEAGIRFAAAARDALRSVDDAVALAHGGQRPLRLGHSWAASRYLAKIVRSWNRSDRPCELSVARVDDRSGGLDGRIVDAAIVRGDVDARRYLAVKLDEEPRIALLPADHPLARRRSLRLEDLASSRLVATSIGLTTPTLWPTGRRPRTAATVGGVDDWLVAIAAGTGFGVSVASTAELYPHPDVRYLPLTDATPVPVLLAYPRRGAHPSCEQLGAVASKLHFRRGG